ncbi:MAG TPA: metallopeptidase TldD-related protein [Casimicrobiaceae bacterium]|nr:metallopeptidase TldD-related protein [Casimicrobiaceae bacterium]
MRDDARPARAAGNAAGGAASAEAHGASAAATTEPLAIATADRFEAHFHAVADAIAGATAGGERFTAWYEAESSDFVRLNRARVRQAGRVTQQSVAVRLVRGARHARHALALSGDLAADIALATSSLAGLRAALDDVAEDPHLLLPDAVVSSRQVVPGSLPPSAEVIDAVLDAAAGEDLVGVYAAGPVARGFANSEGQRNWHAVTTFNLDWSLHHRADKAVKMMMAGFDWAPADLAAKMRVARERLALVTRPARTLGPGRYRAWLAPSAMEEIASLLRWGAFSGRAMATRQSALARMQDGQRLSPLVTLAEDFATGVAPSFQQDGFTRPARVPLVEQGALAGSLVAPRTAREFGMAANGANGWESPEALSMAGGTLPPEDALSALDTGLAIGNLWYLNYSDRVACRMTGMTRFATFWVEGGKVVAPVDVLRFDDSLYRMLGDHLVALSSRPELILSSESYGSRQLASVRMPGALLSELAFTL